MKADAAETALVTAVRELIEEIRSLRGDLAHARPASEKRVDANVLQAINRAVEGRTFTAAELVTHALKVDTEPARALYRALNQDGALSGRRAGKLLARLEGRTLDGLVLAAVGEESAGLVWLVSWVSGVTKPVKPMNTIETPLSIDTPSGP
jgi:hypothetical protein